MLLLLEAQPVARRPRASGRRGLGREPRLDRLAQVAVAAQTQREADLAQAQVEALEQLAQRAQALQLGGPYSR